MFFRLYPTNFPRYASPPDEITVSNIAPPLFKQMTCKLAHFEEGKRGYRLVKFPSSLVNSFVHNLAICSKNALNFKNRLRRQYNSY
jgi:hypothetical protein